MKTTILRAAAAIALATAALMAPTAAQAYVDPSVINVSPSTVAPGQVATFTSSTAPFTGDEVVLIGVTGESAGSVTLGLVKAGIETNTTLRTQAKAGKLSVPITFPSNGSGTYYLTFTGVTSGVVLHSQVPLSAGTAATTPSSKGSLPATGIDGGSTAGLWIAGGTLAAAGAAIGIGTVVRRRRRAVA